MNARGFQLYMGRNVLRDLQAMSVGSDLRCNSDVYMRKRRKGIAASLTGCAALGVVAFTRPAC